MEEKFVSIIVPVYNTPEPLLRSCFESVKNQTNPNWNLIVVDDGSSDTCAGFIDEFCNGIPNTKVIHKRNEGVSSARNVGIKEARSEWITFLDSDNTLPTTAIQNYFETVSSFVDTKIDMVVGFCSRGKRFIENDIDIITLDSDIQKTYKASCEVEYIVDKNEFVNHLLTNRVSRWLDKIFYFADGPVGKLFRNKHSKMIDFPVELKWDEDAIWILNYISSCNEILLIPNVVYNSIEYELSATRRYRSNCIEEFYDVCDAEKKITVVFPLCKEALSYRKFANILLVARLNFFHKDNPKSENIRYEEFCMWCKREETQSVIDDVLKYIRGFSKHAVAFRLFSFFFRLRLYKLCWILLKVYCNRR